MTKKIKKLIIFFSLFLICFTAANFALAQNADSVVWGGKEGDIGDIIGLGSKDPRIIIASIIRVLLGFLGIIALGLVIYSGYLWMTAGGNDEKIDRAKKILINAVIGIIIILSSFGITTFILGKFFEASGGGGASCTPGDIENCGCAQIGSQVCQADGSWGACGGGSCNLGDVCCEWGCDNSCSLAPDFTISKFQPPANDVSIRNKVVRVNFSNNIDGGSLSGNFKLVKTAGTGTLPGGAPCGGNQFACASDKCDIGGTGNCEGDDVAYSSLSVSGNTLSFMPFNDCPAPNGAWKCLDENAAYEIQATAGIKRKGDGKALLCNAAHPCNNPFTTNDIVDTKKPTDLSLAATGNLCVDTVNVLDASAKDDSGIDSFDFSDNKAGVLGNNIPNCVGAAPNFTCSGTLPGGWNPTTIDGYAAGTVYTLTLKATDQDSNTSSIDKKITLRTASCCNGAQDGDETGVDCGGSCGACDGAACDAGDNNPAICTTPDDSICSSNFCDTTSCLCQAKPRIDWVSPIDATDTPNGAIGNFITIGGANFGDAVGEVYFGAIKAGFPDSVNPQCNNNWQDNQIIAVVPVNAVDSPIKVVTSKDSEDSTNDDYGAAINDFKVNAITRPGLCLANPGNGYFGDSFNLQGASLNGAIKTVKFGSINSAIQADNINNWTDISVAAKIPNIKSGNTTVFAEVDGESSNYLKFEVKYDSSKMPIIDYISPDNGPAGQYITIYGSNFKAYDKDNSKVKLKSKNTGAVYNADGLDFPKECQDSWWKNGYIIVKVPPQIKAANDLGDYDVTVANSGGESNIKEFTAVLGEPGPGLCKLDPYNGEAGIAKIKMYGDNFKSNQGAGFVKFFNNKTAAIYDSWSNQKIETVVSVGAASGPVEVSQGTPSNSLPFMVGKCSADDQCDGGDQCCGAGTAFSGLCRPNGTCNAGAANACTYGWTFTTAPKDLDPLTCSGFSNANSCLAAGSCPNSPGQCQSNTGNTTVGGCGDNYCNTTYAAQCVGNNCSYNDVKNKCELNGATCDGTDNVKIPGYTAECRSVSGKNIWQIKLSASCPIGTYKDINGWCTLGAIGAPELCNSCPGGFVCQSSGVNEQGKCVINAAICPAGSTCDLANGSPTENKCKTDDTCECCCRVDSSAQDCCAGLTCKPGLCGNPVDANPADGVNDYGLCTGCKVEIDGNLGTNAAEQEASDQACNCTGTGTRYCDVTGDPSGVCIDKKACDTDSSTAVCDPDVTGTLCGVNEYCDANTCFCEQAKPCDGNLTNAVCDPDNNLCEPGNSCDINTCLCKPKSCDGQLAVDGCQADANACNPATEYCDNTSCTCKPAGEGGPGEACIPLVADPACTVGAAACQEDYACLTNGDCRCCCDPGDGTAANLPDVNAAGLKCAQNITPCEGDNRGLFCGCSNDSQCVDTGSIGCGTDTCCRARPTIVSVLPADESVNICRNAMISVNFDTLMDVSSFSGNVVVVGDYGLGICPKGTQYILAEGATPKGFFSRALFRATNIVKRVLKPFSNNASALTNTYCAISGSVSGVNNADETTTLNFSPSSLLDKKIKYHVIIKGDSDLSDSKKEGVLSVYDVTMADEWKDINGIGGITDDDRALNGVKFFGFIWSFTTRDDSQNNGICKISRVEVEPNSYLFQKSTDDVSEKDDDKNADSFDKYKDNDKVFSAKALTSEGQIIASVPDAYFWDWQWESSDNSIINYDAKNPFSANPPVDDKQLYEANPKITDGYSTLSAKALTSNGEIYSGTANAWVLICENPWPAVKANGEWEPWSDGSQGSSCINGTGDCNKFDYQLYYCRDNSGVGTVDDLPPVLSDKTIIRGSSTTQSLLKEYYFFREVAPDISGGINLNLVNQCLMQFCSSKDGRVFAIWDKKVGVAGYKLYYGKKSGSYEGYKDIKGEDNNSYVLNDLIIGQTYYFSVTAYYATGAESKYSAEKNVLVKDEFAPNAPGNLVATKFCAGSASVSWQANANDTTGYEIYYGTAPGSYGGSNDVKKVTSTTLTGLTTGTTYYLAVKAYDAFKNKSGYSNEVSFIITEQCN